MAQSGFTPSPRPGNWTDSLWRLRDRIFRDMRRLGVSLWGMQKTETQYLPQLIEANERIGGVVYGHSSAGSIMLVATDQRLLYVDTKPLFKKSEGISYDAVSGVTFEWVGLFGTVVVHTNIGTIKVRTMNYRAAKSFHDYLERRCIEHHRRNGY